MYYLKHLRSKIAYNNPLRLFLDGLARGGVRITPFYLMLEKCPMQPYTVIKKSDVYTSVLLNSEDMKAMAAIPLRKFTENDLVNRLHSGCICVGIVHQGELAAFSWANLKENTFDGSRFKLKQNEAYLFDAYTLLPYRGKGLASLARYHMYAELEKQGRTRFYSISDCFNKPSLRFKEKLGARILWLGVMIKLFSRSTCTLKLKQYPESV